MPTSTGKIYLGSTLLSGGSSAQPGYNRPGDWLALPDMSATEGVAGLYAVGNHDSNFVAFTVAGAFHVDWGDGTTDSYASGATAEHNFDWADISSTTLTSRGFRQAIIQITPQSGASITSLNFNVKHSTAGLVTGASTGWLDASVNVPSCSCVNLFNGTNVLHRMLEQITLHASGGTSLQNAFINCSSLMAAYLLNTSSITNFNKTFQGCSSLQFIEPFDTSSATNFAEMFNLCVSLQSIPFLQTSSVTSFGVAFSGCRTIAQIPTLNMGGATNLANAFLNCTSLSRCEATGIKVNVSFANCSLSAAALNEIYANLAPVTGQTITVTGNYGTASDNPTIATAKGWTVTG